MKFLIKTLGCKVNNYESEMIKEQLIAHGFSEDENNPDVCIINTCTVTNQADSKSRQMIRKYKKEFPNSIVIVCGCITETKKENLEIIEADIILGNYYKTKIIDFINEYKNNKKQIIEFEDLTKIEFEDMSVSKYDLNGLTENEMKQKCIRLRNVNFKDGYKVENKLLDSLNIDFVSENELLDFEIKLKENGYLKIFDTKKKDHHYYKDGMNTKVQLQEINDIGLLVYLDNANYYDLSLEEQRNRLIDELNSYGFDFKYTDLGLDKLRTLYYKEEKYSKNQNG